MMSTAGSAPFILVEAVDGSGRDGGLADSSRPTATRSTSAKIAVLVPISSISLATGVGSPGTTSLA